MLKTSKLKKFYDNCIGILLLFSIFVVFYSIFATIDYFRYVNYLDGKPKYSEEQISNIYFGMSKAEVKNILGSFGYDVSADDSAGIERKVFVKKLTFSRLLFGVPRMTLVFENDQLIQAQYGTKKIDSFPSRRGRSSTHSHTECNPSPCI